MTALPPVAVPSSVPVAPLQLQFRFALRLPPDEVFALVADRLPEWFETIHSVKWDHSNSVRGAQSAGACSVRSCDFGGKALREVIASYEPGKRYTYSVDLEHSEFKMPLEDHLGSFELERVGDETIVTWRQYFRAKWFVPAALLRWQMGSKLMRPAIERLMAKYQGRLLDE